MRYDKLVRDRIPEIIDKDGKKAITHVADDSEYWLKLREKLSEEVKEFLDDESEKELADILEVVKAICAYKGYEDVERVRKDRQKKRGGFRERIILEKTQEKP